MHNDPEHTSKLVIKCLKDNKAKVLGVAIAKPLSQSYRKFVGSTKKACAYKKAYKSDPVTPFLLRGMGQKSSKLL